MKSLKINLLIWLMLLGCIPFGMSQRTENYRSPQYEFNTAMELFQKEKFGPAQQYFKYVYEHTGDKQQDLKTNSYFYMGVCAAKLDNQDAGYLLQNFIDRYPVHSYVNEAHYYLGRFYFTRKQYKKVITQFDFINENEIQPENIAEYQFKKGYSYFMTGDYEKAKAMFKEAREQSGPYQQRSIYYLAYLAYQDGQYESALEDFLLLKDNPDYKNDVPQYLTQIYFKQGEYEKVLETAPEITNPNDPVQAQILRCMALSQYNLNKYDEAAANFDKLLTSDKVNWDRNDYYAIGFTYYRQQDYKNAVQYLSKTIIDSVTDGMTQNSYYIIADCYLQQKQFALATQSFKEAAQYDFNEDIKEDALFNYAKLQYETSTSPFNNGIQALEQYITTYPHSSRSEEATSYLSKIYMSTKNYEDAIASIEKINSKSPAILKAYQRCTYFRALELLNNRNHKGAIKLLNKTLSAPIDKDMNLSAIYWKGECQYRDEQYRDAYYTLQTYQHTANASSNDYYNISNYTLGYAALKIKRYSDAVSYFKSFIAQAGNGEDLATQADATARLADCYFMQQELSSAIKYYDQCERMGQANADYALYQEAKCYGYQKNSSKKIQTLEKLSDTYPNSTYIDDADYDLAVTYHTQNEYAQAIVAYKDFIQKHPKSNYIRQVYNRLAQAYLNTDENDMAISTYKYVVETYPGSQEAKDALANLENIYTEDGNTSEFFDYVRNKNMNISADRQDSITFKAAESKYNRGDCEASVKSCGDYLKQFPNGSFAAKAHFYKAECEYGQKQYDAALEDYEAIIQKYKTEYNVTALHKAASILYNDKNYAKALTYFNKLLENTNSDDEVIYGNNGVMHSAYFLKDYNSAYTAAVTIINSAQTDQDLLNESLLIAGNSAMNINDFENAKKYYTQLEHNGTNDLCAEAAYHLAEILLNNDRNLDGCEAKIQAILSRNYSSEYWYARTFILYGDLYKAKGNYFQARHTYQSIVDNYAGEDLIKMAKDKITELDALDASQSSDNK